MIYLTGTFYYEELEIMNMDHFEIRDLLQIFFKWYCEQKGYINDVLFYCGSGTTSLQLEGDIDNIKPFDMKKEIYEQFREYFMQLRNKLFK